MKIDFKVLEAAGFHCELRKGKSDDKNDYPVVEIYPRNHKDIAPELRKLTELPKKDCYELQETILEMQIINAIRSTI